MTRFALDPPALLELVRSSEQPHPSHRLVAPNALRSQALDLLLTDVRVGTLSEEEALALHERCTRLKIRLLGDRVSRRTAWTLAAAHGWTISDAEYLAVARLQADALVALDPGLAAKAEGIVLFAPLTDLFRG